nr:glucokinase [Enterovirga sp. DB1703]
MLADIGGTFARFALLEEPDAAFALLAKVPTSSYPDAVAAISAALAGHAGPRPVSAVIAAAGRVADGTVQLTNAAWRIDPAEIGQAFGLEQVVLLNDYAATAAGLQDMCRRDGDDVRRIGPAGPAPGPQVVLGPGTGFGASAAVSFGDETVLHSTEAGHAELGPATETDFALWPLIERVQGRITVEALLSGPGLVRLYRAVARRRGCGSANDTPAAVVAAGLDGSDTVAAETLRRFAAVLGRFAGDLALVFGATGGVLIAGGIAPRIARILDEGEFRAAFERKAPFAEAMRGVPTYLIIHPEPVLAGLRAFAAAPGRFIVQAGRWSADDGA